MADNDKHRHDFRNHLAIVLWFTESLLAETQADDPRRADLEEIQTAALAALSLLAQLFPVDGETPLQ